MGWAKYHEDNMSIHIGRMAMKDSVLVYPQRQEKQSIEKVNAVKRENSHFSMSVTRLEDQSGRRGLELVFQHGVEESMIRKLQMNGWWWSKANACWCNLDTKGNRRYAESMLRKGAKVSVVV